ncbi:MAG: TonB-dependent receptor [Bacillota bacterium]|nr:TonB-dependent receptor [Bacillota bacterium]
MQRLIHQGARLCMAHTALLLCVLFLQFCTVRTLHAQANAGITGTVTDSTGAVIAGAQITITNQSTGVQNHAVTSSSGTYTVTGLIPGAYSVEVNAGGFKTFRINNINVEVSTTATINATLATGETSETVEVTANPIALNTTSPQLGSTIEPTVVKALPVEVSGRGRQVDQLQFLAPGVTGSTFSHRVNGGVDFEEEIVYNGVPAPQPETEGYTTNFNPPYEMVQEFRVERSTFSAQFGLGQGALTYQMASGTNRYHGDLFEINRNSLFDSVGFFNEKAQGGNGQVPVDHENNYGFTVGGPIWIPKVYDGHNRTFGHYSQEWYKQNNENTGISTVPSALEKTGDFTDFVDGGTGQQIPIFDPTTGKQFMGLKNGVPTPNVIPSNRISGNSQSLLQYLPNPDRPGTGIGGLDSNKSYAPFINPHIQHVWGFTIDQVLTPTQGLHYSQWRNSFSNYSFDYSPFVIAPNPLNSMKFEPALGSGFLLTYNNTVTPNLVMTAGFGWIGEINNQFNITKYSFPAIAEGVIPPNITFDGQHAPTSWGTSGAWLQSINRKLGLALVNNWLWTKGRNTFNIGGEWRRSYQDDNEEQTAGGHFAFSHLETADPNNLDTTGSSFASYLLGLPDSANRSNSQELRLRNMDLSPYIQDDIKLTPKLTLNLGLRWDIQVPFTEMHNNVVFFDPNNPRTNPAAGGLPGALTKFGNCTGCAGYDRAYIHWGHFGPRLGMAYQINDKTVLQAGYSVAFLNGGAYEYGTSKVAVNYGNLLVGSFAQSSTGTNVSAYGSWDTRTMPNPGPTPFSPTLGIGGVQIDAFSSTDGFAPYSQQWNVNVQRELPYDIFLTAAWVGNREIHLPSQLNSINQLDPKYFALGNDLNLSFADGSAQAKGYQMPYPNFANDFGSAATVAQALVPYPQYGFIFNNFEGYGTAYYQSAQLQVEKRFTHGLAFLAGYTIAREYNNTSSGFTSFISNALNKYNQKLEWAPTSGAPPQTLKVSGTYELPIGPGKRFFNNKGVTGQILGGWQVGWITDYESGTPFGVYQNLSFPYPNGGGERPNRNPAVKLSTASYNRERDYFLGKISSAQIFNPSAFTAAPLFTLGNSIRNYNELRNPAYYNEDANVRKHFYFGERFQGILQVDYFNLFNRVQFNGPDNNISDGTFGLAQNAGQNNSNRQGQVMFRLEF